MALGKYERLFSSFLVSSGPVVSDDPEHSGDWESFCPAHEDPATSKKPSARLNFERGIWYCFRCDPEGKDSALSALAKRYQKRIDTGVIEKPTTVVSLEERRETKAPVPDRAPPDSDDLEGYRENLQQLPAKMKWLRTKRGFRTSTVEKFGLGWVAHRQRYLIPIMNGAECINARLYKTDAERDKFMWWTRGGHPNYLINHECDRVRESPWVILMEGEWDAILADQDGLPAVGHTAGAGKFLPEWAKVFEGKIVYICYDNDEAGRKGRRKVLEILKGTAEAVYFVDLPGEGTDYTDYRVRDKTSFAEFKQLLEAVRETGPQWRQQRGELALKGESVTVAESYNAVRNGDPVEIVAQVTGRIDPPYSLPRRVTFTCDMDNGSTCDSCPMSVLHGGQTILHVKADDPMLPRMIDTPEDRADKMLRKEIGARCTSHLDIDVEESWSVEQLVIEETIDRKREAGEEEGNVSGAREIFNVAGHDTESNTSVRLVGTQSASSKDQRVIFTAWHMEEVSTSLDRFRMTTEIHERLSVFQVKPGQDPLSKMALVARDLASNVTGIIGIERRILHMAFDITWHSVLNFRFAGQEVGKGWLEMIVIGDSRTGKSEIAKALQRHYQSGALYSCDQASLAGLVGGVTQPAGRRWAMRWGALPVNDRRAVILDEAQSLKDKGIIEQMSSIRSSGVAEVTKIETASTPARVRTIWIANPASGRKIRDLPDGGMDGVRQLLPAHEDIARFDYGMAVAQDDVKATTINALERPTVAHRYRREACSELVMWAWSRRVDQIRWVDQAEAIILDEATALGDRYSSDFPLVQHENIRIKLARISAAIAARVFSCDESGELLLVGPQHVRAAVKFLHTIYDSDTFGYGRLSRRTAQEERLSHSFAGEVEAWLRGKNMPDHNGPNVLRGLMALGGTFEGRYFPDAAGIDGVESVRALAYLTETQMLRHVSGGKRVTTSPALSAIVRKLDDERIAEMERRNV